MEARVSFAARLGELLTRLEPERTQKWLADQSGLSEATVSRLLQGKRNPDVTMVEALGPVLGVAPDELVRGTDAEERLADSRDWVRKQQYDVALSTIRETKDAHDAALTEIQKLKAALEVQERERTELRDQLQRTFTNASDLAREKEILQAEKKILERRVAEQRDDLRVHRRAVDNAAQQLEAARREIRHLTAVCEGMKQELVKLGRTSLVTKILAGAAAAAAGAAAVITSASLIAQANDDEENDENKKK